MNIQLVPNFIFVCLLLLQPLCGQSAFLGGLPETLGKVGGLTQLPQDVLDSVIPNSGCSNSNCTDNFIASAAMFSAAMIANNFSIVLINNTAIIKQLSIAVLQNFQMTLSQNVCSTDISSTSERHTVQFRLDNFHLTLEIVDATKTDMISFLTKLVKNPTEIINDVCTKPTNSSSLLQLVSLSALDSLVPANCLGSLLAISTSASYDVDLSNVLFGVDTTVNADGSWTVNSAGVANKDTVQFDNRKCTGANGGSNVLCNCVLTDNILREILVILMDLFIPCWIQTYTADTDSFFNYQC